jgi:hypothetical protein
LDQLPKNARVILATAFRHSANPSQFNEGETTPDVEFSDLTVKELIAKVKSRRLHTVEIKTIKF